MNRKQRDQNRANAERLVNKVISCPNCGGNGRHYVHDPIPSIGGDCSGWICDPEMVRVYQAKGAERG